MLTFSYVLRNKHPKCNVLQSPGGFHYNLQLSIQRRDQLMVHTWPKLLSVNPGDNPGWQNAELGTSLHLALCDKL